MSIITSVVPNSKHIQNGSESFKFNDTIEPNVRRAFTAKENRLITELMTKHNAFIAGGFAAHCIAMEQGIKLDYGDVDFYFLNEQDFENAKTFVKYLTGYNDYQLENRPYMGQSIRAATFELDRRLYQLVRATFGTIQEIFDSFDFTNSKAAIRYNPTETGCLEYVFDDKLPKLQDKRILDYRIQEHLTFSTLQEKQKHARSNVERLEKYLERYPNGFWDEESKSQILQQYAWDFKHSPKEPYMVPELCRILTNATQEQLILFFTLGGEWKKAFETNGAHLSRWASKPIMEMMVSPDVQVALGDQTLLSKFYEKLGI